MKVFLSWSGERSRAVASYLRDWLPGVIQAIQPWMSRADIDAGARWGAEVQRELKETTFGILCLTRDNLSAPWILFEAGALAKTVDNTFVCPYLIDLDPSSLPPGPLTQFQAKQANERETWELLATINAAMGASGLTEAQLRQAFVKWWPDLASHLNDLPRPSSPETAKRTVHDMVEEMLGVVRELSRREMPTSLAESSPIQIETAPTRVYQVARELNVSTETLVHLLQEMDIPVRSHMTPLTGDHVSRLRAALARKRPRRAPDTGNERQAEE